VEEISFECKSDTSLVVESCHLSLTTSGKVSSYKFSPEGDDDNNNSNNNTNYEAVKNSWYPLCVFKNVSFEYQDVDVTINLKFSQGKPKNTTGEQLDHLSHHFLQLLMSEELTDVRFIFENEEIKAHSLILKARVPYYKKMLSSKMAEAQSKEIEVKGIRSIVFKEMLKFIYSARMPNNLDEISQELMLAADMYGIDDLKKACSDYILSNLKDDNLVQTLTFFHAYSFKEEEKVYLDHFVCKWPKIDDEQLQYLKYYPDLMMQVIFELRKTAN